jgi:hypothetical protein
MEETQGAPGASEETTGAYGAEAIDAGTVEATDASLDVADTGAAAQQDGDTAISEADAADAADLAQYPESVREDFKALAPEKRKALYEEAEKRAEARITENRQRLEKLEAERKAQEERRAAIRARTGKHTGDEAQTIKLPNGNEIELPSRDEMENLSKTQRGRDELRTKYGLDEDRTEFWLFVLDQNREALDASAEYFDDVAWVKLDKNLRDGIKEELGVEPDTILSNAKSPRDVVKGIVGHFQSQIAQLKKEHEARATALNANAEGLRGRALAGSARELPSGGRSAGTAGHIFTREELGRMDVPTYRQNKAEIERQDRAGLIR